MLHYLAATLYYWIEKLVAKTSNMQAVAMKFRVKVMALQRCINRCIYKSGMAALKRKSGGTPPDTAKKAPKKK